MCDHPLSLHGVYSSIFYVNFHSKMKKIVSTGKKYHRLVCAFFQLCDGDGDSDWDGDDDMLSMNMICQFGG